MHRINAPGYAAGNLFTNGNPSLGVPATEVDDTWLNSTQEEISALIEQAGITLSGSDNAQASQTVQLHVPTIAALKALTPPSLGAGRSRIVHVRGYSTDGDGGEGLFRWDPNSTATDNAGTILQPNTAPASGRWIRQCTQGLYLVDWFGALPDGTTICDTAIAKAIAAAAANGKGVVLFRPSSSFYRCTTAIQVQNDHIYLAGIEGRAALIQWDASYTGHGIEILQSTGGQQRFNTGIKNLRLEPQAAAMSAVIYTLRCYDCELSNLRIDGPGVASATGAAIMMDWGTNPASDYGTGHRITGCTIIGYKNGITVPGSNPERMTHTKVVGNFIYGEAQASSTAIQFLYDGSVIAFNEIEGHQYGVVLNNQGCNIFGNRFESNTSADIYFENSAYNCSAVMNHHASGSGNIVFQSASAQRVNYVLDGTLGIPSQMPKVINRANDTLGTIGPVNNWYNYSESSNPLYVQELIGTSGGTNPFGETVSTREIDFAAGDVLMKIGTSSSRPISFYTGSVKQLTLTTGGTLLYEQAGDSTGSPGAATINAGAGRSAVAAAASSVVITNSKVKSTSIVIPVLQTTDATATSIKSCVCSAGSFTLTLNAAATGNVNFGWVVLNGN